GRGRLGLVAAGAGEPGGLEVELADQVLQAVVGLAGRGGVEGVRLHQVGAGRQVGAVHAGDDVGAGQGEEVVVALEVVRGAVARVPAVDSAGEALAAVVGLGQAGALDHGAHGAVDDQDAFRERGLQQPDAVGCEPGKGCHGVPAMSEMTSKWGARFSRVTVSRDWTSRPAFSTKRRSSRAVKPRFTWPKASTALRWPWRARLVRSRRPPGRSTRAASATACAGFPAYVSACISTTRSKLASAKGRACMSASRTSTFG